MKKILEIKALKNYPPEIATWLWAMEETRRTTKKTVSDLSQEVIDWVGPTGIENSIGTLLYHIAEIEMAWLFFDILEERDNFPKSIFPIEPFADGRLTYIKDMPIEEHLKRLDTSRAIFLERMKEISIEDWSVLRSPEGDDYSVSPAWAVYHLVEHEVGHTAQMAVLKKQAKTTLNTFN